MLLIIIYKNKRLRGGGQRCFTDLGMKWDSEISGEKILSSGIQGHTL